MSNKKRELGREPWRERWETVEPLGRASSGVRVDAACV
jgi:hypothetical protein